MPRMVDKLVGGLMAGDVVAKPVYTEDGSQVIGADTVVMARHIALLKQHDIRSVIVEVEETGVGESGLIADGAGRAHPAIEQLLAVGDGGDPLLKTILSEAGKRLAAARQTAKP